MLARALMVIVAVPVIVAAHEQIDKKAALTPIAVGSADSASAVLRAAHHCGFTAILADPVGPNLVKIYVGAKDHVAMDCTFTWIRQHRDDLHLMKAPDAPNGIR